MTFFPGFTITIIKQQAGSSCHCKKKHHFTCPTLGTPQRKNLAGSVNRLMHPHQSNNQLKSRLTQLVTLSDYLFAMCTMVKRKTICQSWGMFLDPWIVFISPVLLGGYPACSNWTPGKHRGSHHLFQYDIIWYLYMWYPHHRIYLYVYIYIHII